MRDLLLDPNGDLLLSQFDIQLTNNEQIVAQRLRQALLTFKGEWFLNTELGLPYYDNILAHNSLQAIRAIYIDAIKKVQGVQELVKFELELKEARTLLIKFSVIDDLNNLIELEI